jgi:hypothetical protein
MAYYKCESTYFILGLSFFLVTIKKKQDFIINNKKNEMKH